MRMRYNGYEVDFNVKKFMEASCSTKIKIMNEITVDKFFTTKKKVLEYWCGFVDVNENHITLDDDGHKRRFILSLSIITGRKHKGHWFSNISRQMCEELIADWNEKKKRYRLHIDLGGGAYQDYTFNRYQKDILLKKLMESLQKEWYDEPFTD